MNIGFDRKVEEIQLLGKQYKIASLTINDLIALDMIDGTTVPDLKSGHLDIHKMIVSICYALSINYTSYRFYKNPFRYFKNRKLKKELSYKNLKDKLSLKNIMDITIVIGKLNSVTGEDDGVKKKME